MNGRFLPALAFAAIIGGCQVNPAPNPNDPNEVSAQRQPFVIAAYMKQMWGDVVMPAEATRVVSEEKGNAMMVEGAKAYLKNVRLKATPPELQWMVAQAYLTAHDWDRAEKLLKEALKVDAGADRTVNDTLRLARCQAELGDVDDAIKTARSTFSTESNWKWPILYSVYFEIVPAAEREKPASDIELAHLLEDSIKQHEAATSTPGEDRWREDDLTRPRLIDESWSLIVKLYNEAHRPDLAQAAAAAATKKSTATVAT